MKDFTSAAGDAPEQKILERNQPFVFLLGQLLSLQRFDLGEFGVGHSGHFGEAYLREYYKRSKTIAFASVGFGYTEDTVMTMTKEGFPVGPNIALHFNLDNPLQQETYLPIINSVKNYFENLGIQCFAAKGGHFPDQLDYYGLVFNVSDPDFLEKVKLLYIQACLPEEAEKLRKPRNMFDGRMRDAYAHSIMQQLRTYGEEIGAVNPRELGDDQQLPVSDNSLYRDATDHARARFGLIKEGIDAMLPVLSVEERTTVIMTFAQHLARKVAQQTAQREEIVFVA
jgi:hypothetical protein